MEVMEERVKEKAKEKARAKEKGVPVGLKALELLPWLLTSISAPSMSLYRQPSVLMGQSQMTPVPHKDKGAERVEGSAGSRLDALQMMNLVSEKVYEDEGVIYKSSRGLLKTYMDIFYMRDASTISI
mmetsp:Transcript_10191/g.15320  ORF Transcript_10191/g.15320 Transcript_10191/m.15320 type:complete len:127 (-) Transcript_10191:82-462(-)